MEQQMTSEQAGQMNFNLPHDVVTLPSQGVFYKSKKKSVKVGYLTAADENVIASAISGVNRDQLALSLIKHKIYETDLKAEELLDGDIEAILIFLRNTSFGPEYTVKVTDPDTGRPFTATLVLDELNIKKPFNEPDQNGLFETTLPKSGAKVKLKPLNYTEILELERMAESYPQGRVVPRVTWKLTKQIIELNGSTDKSMIAQFVESMPIMDSKHIRQFMLENEPRLDLKKEVLAPSGKKVSVDITFGVDFFRPFF